jgi:hypothetical protein
MLLTNIDRIEHMLLRSNHCVSRKKMRKADMLWWLPLVKLTKSGAYLVSFFLFRNRERDLDRSAFSTHTATPLATMAPVGGDQPDSFRKDRCSQHKTSIGYYSELFSISSIATEDNIILCPRVVSSRVGGNRGSQLVNCPSKIMST